MRIRRIQRWKLSSYLFVPLFLVTISCQTLTETDSFTGRSSGPDGVSFAVVGDVMVHSPQLTTSWYSDCGCHNFHPVFEEVSPYIQKADFAIANLETTLPGDPKLYSGYPQFGAPDSLVAALKETGFDILTTANNHSVDKKKEGLIRTVDVVREHGFLQLGTYTSRSDYEKHRILTIEKGGLRFALLNYTYGTNGIPVPKGTFVNLIDKDLIRKDLEIARKTNPDGIIVLYHFGGEYLRYPDQFQKEMVQFAFMEGADIVLGGHPHVLQPFEVQKITDRYGETKDRLVIYSLGNFISNQQRRFTDGGMIFQFRVLKNPGGMGLVYKEVEYEPVWVYVGDVEGKRRHVVVPVEEYLKESSGKKLPLQSRRLMMRFYRDTTSHLEPSVRQVQRYEKELFTTNPEGK